MEREVTLLRYSRDADGAGQRGCGGGDTFVLGHGTEQLLWCECTQRVIIVAATAGVDTSKHATSGL